MGISINLIASLLIIFLPALLISGSFLPDLSVVLIDSIFLFILFKEKNFEYLNNKLFKLLIFFNIYISLRSFFADDILFSLKSSLTYFRFTLLIFAIKFFLERNEKLFNHFSKIFFLTIFVLFIDSFYQYINGYNLLGFKIENPDKLNSLFGDEGVLGSYLIRLLPLFLVCFLNFNKNSYFLILIIFIFGFFIFLAGSRTSIALYLLFFVTFFLLFYEYRKYIFQYLVVLSILVFLLLINLNIDITAKRHYSINEDDKLRVESDLEEKISYTMYYNLIDPVKRIFEGGKNINEIKIFSEVYDAHYKAAFKMFQDHVYFGIGNKMFRKLCGNEKYYINNYSCSTHPHNLYLQILAENGLFGFIFIIIIFIYLVFNISKEFFIRNFKKFKNLNDQYLLLLIGVFLNFWPIVPFGNFYNNWLSIIIYLPIGFLLYFKSKND